MLTPRLLRLLTLDSQDHPRGQGHLSSASGLVRAADHLYIVADDEIHLACLDARDPGASEIHLVRIGQDRLPGDKVARKAAKPDTELLVHLPGDAAGERDRLVLFGSGSRPTRERAFVLALQPDGALADMAREVSLEKLYEPLRARFGELNLEAGYVADGRLHLFQRAHGSQPLNGHVTYDARMFGAWLDEPTTNPPVPLSVEPLDLGAVSGVPLGITDAASRPGGGFIFTAVAEDTNDAYNDGACVGSVVGWCDDAGRVHACEQLAGAPKVEGIAYASADRLWLVTDADDPARPSELLELQWTP
ncbi:MAG: hypothetical protein V4787_18195 [Pseudomonadota bacterium]